MTGQSEQFPQDLQIFAKALEFFISSLPENSRVAVAFSGGLDSTVLLHLLSQSKVLQGRVSAHYIDHGLQPILSKDWADHCKKVSDELGISFKSTSIQISSTKREGVESVARRLRYQALTEGMLGQNSVLVTGHHQRDQAETVLLNLMRGAGVSGLSAMPASKKIVVNSGFVEHLRPLLQVPYALLVEYAEYFNLTWIEDPSNQSLDYRRNVIRTAVLPIMKDYWPSVEKTIARTAQNMSEAQVLLDKMAMNSLGEQAQFKVYLDIALLSSLEWLEQKNCIRHWLLHNYNLVLSTPHFEWIASVLKSDGQSRQGRFSYQLSQGELRFFKQRFYYLPKSLAPYLFELNDVLQKLGQEALILSSVNVDGDVGKKVSAGGQEDVAGLADLGGLHSFDFAIELNNLDRYRVRSVSQDDEVKRKRLKSFFQRSQVPVWERSVWPVLEYKGQLVSVLGCSGCVTGAEALQTKGARLGFSQLEIYELLRLHQA